MVADSDSDSQTQYTPNARTNTSCLFTIIVENILIKDRCGGSGLNTCEVPKASLITNIV